MKKNYRGIKPRKICTSKKFMTKKSARFFSDGYFYFVKKFYSAVKGKSAIFLARLIAMVT